MSVTIATVAGNAGLGTSRQVIWAINSGNWWAFAWTGTATLSSWYSSDGSSWTAGATTSIFPAHHSDGRGLTIGYANIAGRDVVYAFQSDNCIATNANHSASIARGTIAGTTLTWHTSQTAIITGVNDGLSGNFSGGSVIFDSTNRPVLASSLFNFYDPGAARGSGVDAGAAEQATPLTWTQYAVDSGVAQCSRSACLVDLGSGTVGLLTDDGSGIFDTTGVDWYTWNGSAWTGSAANQAVTGAITAIGKNDWGAVAVSPTDVHVVYRNASGSLVHRRWNGTSWSAGQAIPSGVSPATGTGVALTTDGVAVFLVVIDTDVAATVQSIKWKPLSQSGVADAWQTWTALETSVQTRTWIGVTPLLNAGTGIVYWSEGTLLVSTTFNPPPDPQTWAFVQQKQGHSASASSLAVQFDNNVVSGNRIVVGIACGHNTATTFSSISDSGSNAYNADASFAGSDNSYIRSAPIVGGAGTRITVTVNISGADDFSVWIAEYSGLSTAANAVDTSGTFDGAVASTAHSATTAGSTTAQNEPAIFLNNDDGAGGSQTGAGGLTIRGSDAASAFTSSFGDKNIVTLATATGNVTTGVSVAYTGIVVVYKLAPPSAAGIGQINPAPTWRRRYWRGTAFRPLWQAPAGIPPLTLAGEADAISSGTGTLVAAVSLQASAAAVAGGAATLSLSVAATGVGAAAGAAAATHGEQVAVAGSAPAAGTASAVVSIAAGLAGAVAVQSMGSATLSVAKALSGAAQAQSSAAAALGESVGLAGSGASAAALSASTSQTVALSGSAAETSTAGLSIVSAAQLAGAAAAVGSASATLNLAAAVVGTAPATGALAATLGESVALLSAAATTSSGTANLGLSSGTPLAGSAAGTSGARATLAIATSLSGQGTASSGAPASLTLAVALVGATTAASGGSANLLLSSGTPVAGAAGATSGARATLSLATALSGATAAPSGATASVGLAFALGGTTSSATGVAASLAMAAALAGTATGTAQLVASLRLAVLLAGTVDARSAAAATLTLPGSVQLAGLVAILVSGRARLSGFPAPGLGPPLAATLVTAGRDRTSGSQGRDEAATGGRDRTAGGQGRDTTSGSGGRSKVRPT
jgi:hypothetical protein